MVNRAQPVRHICEQLFPGACYAGQNNDVYNGPVDDTDNDGDGQINEDNVDGNDDDADGLTHEDWWG